MFNEHYGLNDSVLSGYKTMTRRIIPLGLYNQTDWKAVSEGDYEAVVDGDGYYHDIRLCGKYQVGEEVAVAQKYRNLIEQGYLCRESDGWVSEKYITSPGYSNKMFVRADLMPHSIRITDIKVERLQDISEEDCLREGIVKTDSVAPYGFPVGKGIWKNYRTPQDAFASLIDKVSGKGTWNSNPWVFAYTFELVM